MADGVGRCCESLISPFGSTVAAVEFFLFLSSERHGGASERIAAFLDQATHEMGA